MIVDDVSNGLRIWRRAFARRRRTWNVVAQAGDPDAERVLVVLAHHDAAPSGLVFDQSMQRWFVSRWPSLVENVDTSLPMWWPIAGAPALSALGSALGSRRLTRAGVAACLAVIALGLDVARNRTTPGANDNLSGVAALVALAERLREAPLPGVRVLLVSCGAEEVLQGGIYGFAKRHFAELAPSRTWFLNLDTIGSPELIMLEGEGCFLMEEYPDPGYRDRIASIANELGVPLRRGLRSRSSTDAVLPSRAGYGTATLASIDEHKCLSNYHLMSDTPENLSYDTIGQAVELAHAMAGDLAGTGARRAA
jgi:Iap family predicted aminopeptidase